MKKITKHIHLLILSLIISLASCEDLAFGDKFLQKPPSGDVTIDTIFSTADYARRVLWYAYGTLPWELPKEYDGDGALRFTVLESLTDLNQATLGWSGAERIYYSGTYNAGYEDRESEYGCTKYRIGSWWKARQVWKGIRHAWTFINNVDRVSDMDGDEKERLKAEAKLIIAIHYVDMIRHLGAMPIIDRAYAPEEVDMPPRATLQETVNFAVKLLDEAGSCKQLPWALPSDDLSNWSGRLTRGAALGLKARLLLFVASPLFNDAEPYYPGEAADKHMTWFGGYDAQRWEDARQACEDFFTENQKEGGYYKLVQPASADLKGYRKAFQDAYYTRGTTESLISVRRYNTTNNTPCLIQSMRWGGWCPTKEFFDMFQMTDGTDFDWNNPEHRQNPFINRDPRLCESILLDGDDYQGTKAEVFIAYPGDEANYPQGKHVKVSGYTDSNSIMGSGIAARKFALDRAGEYKNRSFHWPHLRLAELYLSYAEALNECNRTGEAYQYVNEVRARVGLPPLKLKGEQDEKTEFREAILRERACEFGYENVRFFDLIRWKREDIFTKSLHKLNFYRHKDTKEYKFEFPELLQRAWQKPGGFSPKWYLSAFSATEVNINYGLVQNPGWE